MAEITLRAKDYHQRSKHQLHAYARGPEGLDWDDQPDPFRRFIGSPQVPLQLKARELTVTYTDLFIPNIIGAKHLSLENIAILCELAIGLSAWKVYGSARWSLRCNPSSGNLHPTEAYFILPQINSLDGGVYHYQSHDHVLEQRCKVEQNLSTILKSGTFLIGLSSIQWREAWKYGERAYRYCQLDVGHMIASIRYAAACLGWQVTIQKDWSDETIAAILGINRHQDFNTAETESPDTILLIETQPVDITTVVDGQAIAEACLHGIWQGQANVLSQEHEFTWPVLDEVEQACVKDPTANDSDSSINTDVHFADILQPQYLHNTNASEIIRRRRSAQAFDGTSLLPFSAFCRLLDALRPRNNIPPFDVSNLQSYVHVVLFVHRVEGINPGLYCLPRSQQGESLLREEFSPQFEWQRIANIPDSLPLYLLVRAKCERAAHTLSCHQAIAADSAFSLAMIAEFDQPLSLGDWMYRRLFWEAGLLGQSLYLEAEAAGMRGTGIGCYFDDKVHEILGITSTRLQDLYHFTVGSPQMDSRLATLPPYSHLEPRG
jgi:SagB-type dehydrogenase family enzyme